MMDKLVTCKFPYSTKMMVILFELLRCNLPYDCIRYIWEYYVLVPPGLFDNIPHVILYKSNALVSLCRNLKAYKNNLIYTNLTNIITEFEYDDGDEITFRIRNISDDGFLNYSKLLDNFMIKMMYDADNENYKYNWFRQQGIFLTIKKSKINSNDSQKYFDSIKNIGMFFKIHSFRNDIDKTYIVIFNIKAIEYAN